MSSEQDAAVQKLLFREGCPPLSPVVIGRIGDFGPGAGLPGPSCLTRKAHGNWSGWRRSGGRMCWVRRPPSGDTRLAVDRHQSLMLV